MHRTTRWMAGLLAIVLTASAPAIAADIKVLTTGAMRGVVTDALPLFESQTGHKVTVDNATAGAVTKRIEDGEAFDVVINTPAMLDDLAAKDKIKADGRANLAKVGIGVAVKMGAPLPDIATVEAFKQTLLKAASVAYIDPASGGSSGIYFDKLLEKMGIADHVRPRAKLKRGGYAADLVASGEAELAVHQISEIVPVKGVVLVGPLPPDVQNFTTYAVGISASAKETVAAKALVEFLTGPAFAIGLKARGMTAP